MLSRLYAPFALLLGLAATGGVHATPLTVYSNTFDSPAVLAGGATGGLSGITTLVSVQGYSADGFSGNFLRNDTGTGARGTPAVFTTLTLGNLPTHDSIDINFLLALIDSWDSDNGAIQSVAVTPEFFNVSVDGINILQITAANTSGSNTYGGAQLGTLSSRGFSGFNDRAFNMGPESLLSRPHTASTLTIDFFASGVGWQGGTDESWAIENLNVVVDNAVTTGVPEPASLALLGMGLAGFAATRRKL